MERLTIAALCWCCVLALAAPSPAREEEAALCPYGGWRKAKSPATGWFRTARENGRWWLVDPDGHKFLSMGLNHVSYAADRIQGSDRSPYREAVAEHYGSPQKWGEEAVKRLRGWGFNTIGAWSDPVTWRQRMPYTVILDLAHQVKWHEGQSFPDVFAPIFAGAVERAVRRSCQPLVNDPWLIGYFTDNELYWGLERAGSESLFVGFLRLPDPSPGRRAVLRFLAERYLTIEELNEDWGTQYEFFEQVGRVPQVGAQIPRADEDDFLRLVAERYFTVTEEAIRAVDPNHLVLGCRFAGEALRPVLEGLRGHVDVISVNYYDAQAPKALLREVHRLTDCPVLITEFSFRARDSGLPNTKGAGVVVDTQEERAKHFERYVRELLALPMVVGYHWFEHADEPVEGRFDGEDSNYGVVDIQDHPYQVLVSAMTRVNGSAYELASEGGRHARSQ